jgi:hypothetical protein
MPPMGPLWHILQGHFKGIFWVLMLLRTQRDQIQQVKDRGRRPEGGGVEREQNNILLQESAYVPSSKPKAKTLQDGNEHTNQ